MNDIHRPSKLYRKEMMEKSVPCNTFTVFTSQMGHLSKCNEARNDIKAR